MINITYNSKLKNKTKIKKTYWAVFAAVLAHTSKLQSTVLERQKTLNDKKKLLSLQLFGLLFIQNKGSMNCPPFQQLLQTLTEEMRQELSHEQN